MNEYPSIDPDGPLTPTPEPVPPVSLTYDAAGNLTVNPLVCNPGDVCEPGMPCGMGSPICGSGQRYVYDQENRLTAVYGANSTPEVTTDDMLLAQYEYDALGRRVSSIEYVNAETGALLTPPKRTRHVYVGLETIEEYDVEVATEWPYAETATLAREFLWGDPGSFPEPVVMVTHGGASGGQGGIGVPAGESVYHYLHDALGSVVGLTDSTGALVERYTYDPYGRTLIEIPDGQGGWIGASASAFGNPFMWTGQRYDAGTGLYAFFYRTYSPTLGRWLQRDPAGYIGGVNLYAYLLGKPLGDRDSLGLEGDDSGERGCEKVPDWTDKNRPPWDPANNPCHKACASGRNKAVYNRGMDWVTSDECINRCRAHCDRKKDEGNKPDRKHGDEFWKYDEECGTESCNKPAKSKDESRSLERAADVVNVPGKVLDYIRIPGSLICEHPVFAGCREECGFVNDALYNCGTNAPASVSCPSLPEAMTRLRMCMEAKGHTFSEEDLPRN